MSESVPKLEDDRFENCISSSSFSFNKLFFAGSSYFLDFHLQPSSRAVCYLLIATTKIRAESETSFINETVYLNATYP